MIFQKHCKKIHTKICEYYGIDRKLFKYLISHGWSLEKALTNPPEAIKPDKGSP